MSDHTHPQLRASCRRLEDAANRYRDAVAGLMARLVGGRTDAASPALSIKGGERSL